MDCSVRRCRNYKKRIWLKYTHVIQGKREEEGKKFV